MKSGVFVAAAGTPHSAPIRSAPFRDTLAEIRWRRRLLQSRPRRFPRLVLAAVRGQSAAEPIQLGQRNSTPIAPADGTINDLRTLMSLNSFSDR